MSSSSETMLHVHRETDKAAARSIDNEAKEEYAYSVGIQAVLFLMPLKMQARERRIRERIPKANPKLPAAPVNQIGHQRMLARAGLVMPYTPNNDTIYSGAVVDVSYEPMILHVPDILDRYFSVQIGDAYIVNQRYIGTRVTGGYGGDWAFVGPDWAGDLPEGVHEHRLPSNTGIFAVRILVENEAELPVVHGLQNQFHLFALSEWGKPLADAKPAPFRRYPPAITDGELAWLQDAWQLMQLDRPTAEHAALLKMFESVGLFLDQPLVPDKLDPAFRRGLVSAIKAGHEIVRWKAKFRGSQSASRWNVDLVGGSYGHDYLARAEGAVQGLFVHDAAECLYFHTYMDGNNDPLDGAKEYLLHFEAEQLSPTHSQGFWSITMYGADYQLVANPLNRYALTDRTADLQYNQDGSLDLYIQNEPPPGHESNWLPSPPNGIFRLNFRVYLPQAPLLERTTVENYLPPLVVVESWRKNDAPDCAG